mgnify:CR=1 FL=1
MNPKITQDLIQFHQELFILDKRDLIAIIDVLAMNEVETYIASTPLPQGADPDAMRSIMLMVTITRAIEHVQRLLSVAAGVSATGQSSTPEQEETAKAEAAAIILKAQGKLN